MIFLSTCIRLRIQFDIKTLSLSFEHSLPLDGCVCIRIPICLLPILSAHIYIHVYLDVSELLFEIKQIFV